MAAGAGAACWLLGMLLASTAHAAETPEDTADVSEAGLLADVRGELATLTEAQDAEGDRGDSGLLGSVTSTTLGAIERTTGDLVDSASDRTQAGLDNVVAALPAEPPDKSAVETPRSPGPASQAPAQRPSGSPSADEPQPQPQPREDFGREIQPERKSHAPRTPDFAAEILTIPPAEQVRTEPEDAGRSRSVAQRTTTVDTAVTGSDSPSPAPGTPVLPSVPSTPASPATVTAHAQDGSQSGKQLGVRADSVTAAVRLEPIAAGADRASGGAGGIPVRPGASPD